MKFKKLILSLLIFFSFILQATADTNEKNWSKTVDRLDSEQKKIHTNLEDTARSIALEKKNLKANKIRLENILKKRKKRVQELRSRLILLKKEEQALKKELAAKETTLNSIKKNVKGTAHLLLKGKVMVPGNESDTTPIKETAFNDVFPGKETISLVLSTLLHQIENSGKIIKKNGTIYTEEGKPLDAEILYTGSFQAFYRSGDKTGFLVPDSELDTLETAAYQPDTPENQIIAGAFSGENNIIPFDLTAGTILRNPPEKETWFSSIEKGGMFIWPFAAIALISFFLILERSIVLFRMKCNGEEAASKKETKAPKTPAEHVVAAVVKGENLEQMENLLEETILARLPYMERFLQTIKIFATISPLLGLLGTVSGIIKTFTIITAHGNGDPALLSAGISEALVTTKLGLILAIPLLLAHHILQKRANTIVLDMEHAGAQLITEKAME